MKKVILIQRIYQLQIKISNLSWIGITNRLGYTNLVPIYHCGMIEYINLVKYVFKY